MQHTNQLIHQTSPYLLQHAHNPVNWLPYGQRAFEEAQRSNKPMLISIGYASCHWCHVMAHESFENDDIAKVMNDKFVCVKVDREERPDVDHVYMDAVQQIQGMGGWPLNCFALPDGRPFWGGTYFRPDQWKQLLENVDALYRERFEEIEKQASELAEGVKMQNQWLLAEAADAAPETDFKAILSLLLSHFDPENGGLQGAPKFPMPVVLEHLQQAAHEEKHADALRLLDVTLLKMACGGIYDQVGGGFSRYSTDGIWKVPHFEKMLYDNAQLVSTYAKAYKLTGKGLYKEITEQTIAFVMRELMAPEGVFYSALDADSQGEEGLYYTWTYEQFAEILGPYAGLGAEYYALGTKGLWENGRNILLRPENDSLFAQQHFLSADELASLTAHWRTQLLNARSERLRPALDDKMLVSWNALMISSLLDAYLALGRDEYLQTALSAAHFVLNNLKNPAGGLYHTWKAGTSQIHAFLDDYAFTCEAFLKLYALTTDRLWLNETTVLASYAIANLFDEASGFFWYSEKEDKHVFARKIEIYDGVTPSGNASMASVLHTLGIFMHNNDYIQKVRHMLQTMQPRFSRSPAAYAHWATLAATFRSEPFVIAVVGPHSFETIREFSKLNIARALIFGSRSESNLPYFANRYVEGKTIIYVCSGTHCLMPVQTVTEAVALLQQYNRV